MSSERIRKKWPSSRSCYDEGRGIYSTTKDSRICTIIKTIWKPHSSKNHLEKSYLILSFYLSLHFARKNSHRFLYLEYVLCQYSIRSLFNALYRKDTNDSSLYSFSPYYNTYEYLFSSPSKGTYNLNNSK